MRLKKVAVFVFLLMGVCFSSLSAKSLNTQITKDKTSLNQLKIATQLQHNCNTIARGLESNGTKTPVKGIASIP